MQTFQDHVQTLVHIISGKVELSVMDWHVLLAQYVVGSSHRKMRERIKHKNSRPYMNGLLAITDSLSTADYQPLEPLKLKPCDKTFLLSIPLIISKLSHDASRCKKIDCKFNLNCEYKLHLPKLCQIAEIAKTSTEAPMFYTEGTFTEYHRLLVNLLEHFKFHLGALVRPKNCHHHINMVRFFGSALHGMVSTEVMVQHAKNIAESLGEVMNKEELEKAGQGERKAGFVSGIKHRLSKLAVAEAGDGDEGEGAEMEGDEFDESLASIQFQSVEYKDSDREEVRHTVASRCFQWLRLMTTYFDAMDQLLGVSTLPRVPKNATIQVVAVKHPGLERMDWKRCFQYLPDSDIFPNSDELVAAFEKHLLIDNYHRTWFDPTGTFRIDNFPGTWHCEAIGTILVYRQRNGSPVIQLPVCYRV